MSDSADPERRRRIRRSTILLVLLVAAVYALSIALSVIKGP